MAKEVRPDHYASEQGIQPIDLINAFDLNFHEGSVVKYVCRWRRPGGGGLQALKKAYTYLGWLIEREEAKQPTLRNRGTDGSVSPA